MLGQTRPGNVRSSCFQKHAQSAGSEDQLHCSYLGLMKEQTPNKIFVCPQVRKHSYLKAVTKQNGVGCWLHKKMLSFAAQHIELPFPCKVYFNCVLHNGSTYEEKSRYVTVCISARVILSQESLTVRSLESKNNSQVSLPYWTLAVIPTQLWICMFYSFYVEGFCGFSLVLSKPACLFWVNKCFVTF